MEKQPNEPEDFTNEPLPSMTEPMEVQDAGASTLAMPFLQPIITTFKSKAQKQREYRQRIAASRTAAQAAAARKLKNERQRKNRLRQAANLAIASGSLEATTTSSTSSSRSGEESNNVQTRSQQQHSQQQSATPFAKPITAARKTRAQIQREYRQRIAASKTPAQAAAAREARNLRERNNRLRRAANLAIASGSLEATTTSSSRSRQKLNTVHISTQRQFTDQQLQTLAKEPATTVQPSTSSDQIEVQAQSTWNTKWASSIMRFKSTFLDDYGYACSVCDRLWFRNDLKPITAAQLKWHKLSVEQRAEYYDQACEEQRRYALLHPYRLCRCPKRKPRRDDINLEKCQQKDNTDLGNQETEPWLKREASPVDIEYNRYVSQQYEFTKFAFELNAKEDDAKSCFERNVRQDTKLNDNGKEIKIEPCEMNNEIEDFVPHTVKLEIIEYEETKIGGIASQAAAVEMIKVENIKEENIEL